MSAPGPHRYGLLVSTLLAGVCLPIVGLGWIAGVATLCLQAGYKAGRDWLHEAVERLPPDETTIKQETDT